VNTQDLIYLLTYLILYSFLGWVLESICKTIEQRKFINSGFLNGPICPIYGCGAIIMILCLNSLKDNIFLLFIISFLVLSLWEYIVGVLLEKIFKTKYWDYSHLKFNIKGRICLKNSIYWGILGVLFIKYIHPFIETKIALVPLDILIYTNIILYIALIVDTVASSVKTIKLDKAILKLEEIENSIKEKIEELKEQSKNRSSKGLLELEEIIRELRINQTKLKIRLYKTTKRLREAFPSMKSEIITNFLSEKIDLKALKQYIKDVKKKITDKSKIIKNK